MSDGGAHATLFKHVLRELGPAGRRYYGELEKGNLSTTWCERCDRPHFPPRERC